MTAPLLALETSAEQPTVAIETSDGISHRSFEGGRGKHLIPEIDALLKECAIDKNELGGIVVGTGPGSYTGLRIACAAARSLEWALKIPARGFCSFEAMALDGKLGQDTHILINAFRGELYHACYRREQDQLEVVTAPRVIAKDDGGIAVPAGANLIGDPNLLPHPVNCLQEQCIPLAQHLLLLAKLRGFNRGTEPAPLYLRVAR
ncbi:MAG: tRNA (adenosine(37)-N6)-threonylcarbamoyltransferase complex dimerization subunit type 1 TsaB [Planctomycetota bacterium]|nr:MAG: tRNA (adenosine(37)-N6)-threonylcarbamoyltransferase complex dimerization subunit type 1 TsaB [Planctomycetota bacterium]